VTEEATPVTDQPVEEVEGRQGGAAPSGVRGRLKAMDPARRITLLVLAVVLVLFAWHLVSDRGTPYTQFGKVDGYVVPIASQVSGYVSRVDVVLNEGFSASRPRPLFEGRLEVGVIGNPDYDVTADGQRFLMVKRSEASAPVKIHVILNWDRELAQLFADQV